MTFKRLKTDEKGEEATLKVRGGRGQVRGDTGGEEQRVSGQGACGAGVPAGGKG